MRLHIGRDKYSEMSRCVVRNGERKTDDETTDLKYIVSLPESNEGILEGTIMHIVVDIDSTAEPARSDENKITVGDVGGHLPRTNTEILVPSRQS